MADKATIERSVGRRLTDEEADDYRRQLEEMLLRAEREGRIARVGMTRDGQIIWRGVKARA